MKEWTYSTSHSYQLEDGRIITMYSQLYQVGVYCCVEGFDDRVQLNLPPKEMVKQIKAIQKDKKLKNLKIGSLITVIEKDGFYYEKDNL